MPQTGSDSDNGADIYGWLPGEMAVFGLTPSP